MSSECDGAAYAKVESQQASFMSRNFYILAGSLMVFTLIAGTMAFVPSSFQPGLPANGRLWRTIALIFLLLSLASALVGMLTNLFEQVDRRTEEDRQEGRRKRRRNRDL